MGLSKRLDPATIDELTNIMLGCDLGNAHGLFFNMQTLIDNDALNKYKETKLGDKLREQVLLASCTVLRQKDEDITEKKLITILRSLLRTTNYTMNTCSENGKMIYFIFDEKSLPP